MADFDRLATDLYRYGRPYVHFRADKTRLRNEIRKSRRKEAMQRAVHVGWVNRVSGRTMSLVTCWMGWDWARGRRPGGQSLANPPKSPTKAWLLSAGFQECPF